MESEALISYCETTEKIPMYELDVFIHPDVLNRLSHEEFTSSNELTIYGPSGQCVEPIYDEHNFYLGKSYATLKRVSEKMLWKIRTALFELNESIAVDNSGWIAHSDNAKWTPICSRVSKITYQEKQLLKIKMAPRLYKWLRFFKCDSGVWLTTCNYQNTIEIHEKPNHWELGLPQCTAVEGWVIDNIKLLADAEHVIDSLRQLKQAYLKSHNTSHEDWVVI